MALHSSCCPLPPPPARGEPPRLIASTSSPLHLGLCSPLFHSVVPSEPVSPLRISPEASARPLKARVQGPHFPGPVICSLQGPASSHPSSTPGASSLASWLFRHPVRPLQLFPLPHDHFSSCPRLPNCLIQACLTCQLRSSSCLCCHLVLFYPWRRPLP